MAHRQSQSLNPVIKEGEQKEEERKEKPITPPQGIPLVICALTIVLVVAQTEVYILRWFFCLLHFILFFPP